MISITLPITHLLPIFIIAPSLMSIYHTHSSSQYTCCTIIISYHATILFMNPLSSSLTPSHIHSLICLMAIIISITALFVKVINLNRFLITTFIIHHCYLIIYPNLSLLITHFHFITPHLFYLYFRYHHF